MADAMQDTQTPAPSSTDPASGAKADGWEDNGDWRHWGASYYRGSWGNAYNHWGNYNWHKQQSFEDDQRESPSEEAKVLNSFLVRGSTLDRLSSADLQTVVEEIEKVRSQREAEEKNEKPASGKKPEAAEAKKAAAAGKKPDEAPKATTAAATEAGKTPAEAPAATAAAAAAASKDEKAEVQDEEGKGSKPAETKEERRKRLHARNMRFYRSFASTLFATISGVQSCRTVLQIVAADCDHDACMLATMSQVRRAPKKSQECRRKPSRAAQHARTCSSTGCSVASVGQNPN